MLSKALETTERARGRALRVPPADRHCRLPGRDAVRLLREAGHGTEADLLEREVLGRNVIPGHWTFQIIEEYNRTYYQRFADLEHRLLHDLAQGRDHIQEAELKQRRHRRTEGDADT